MRNINLLILFGFVLILLGFKNSSKTLDLIKLNETLYVDKCEVSNNDWLIYVNSLKESNEDYISALPDTNVWISSDRYFAPYLENYFRHPAFKEFPVVGVSYEQAVKYCDWKTKHNNENFKFRLPTKSEWIDFSSIDISDKDKKKIKKLNKSYIELDGKFVVGNFKTEAKLKGDYNITAPIKSNYANLKGIYNIYGNVSEMVLEKGIVMGGDYETLLSDFKKDYTVSYDKPTRTIGFRCVAEKK